MFFMIMIVYLFLKLIYELIILNHIFWVKISILCTELIKYIGHKSTLEKNQFNQLCNWNLKDYRLDIL